MYKAIYEGEVVDTGDDLEEFSHRVIQWAVRENIDMKKVVIEEPELDTE